MKTKQYRQGDVFIEQIEKSDRVLTRCNNKLVLAEGEATGHHHLLECEELESWKDSEELQVRVGPEATITHEEHATINLTKGTYRVTRQREYTPEEIRRVQD